MYFILFKINNIILIFELGLEYYLCLEKMIILNSKFLKMIGLVAL